MTGLKLAARRLARRPLSTALVGLLTGATLAAAGLIGTGLHALSSLDAIGEQPAQFMAFVDPGLEATKRARLVREIEGLTAVESARLLAPETLVEQIRTTLADTPELIDGVDARWMPSAIDIVPAAGALAGDVVDEVSGVQGVSEVWGGELATGTVARLSAIRNVAEKGGWAMLFLLAASACALISGIAGLQAMRSAEETDLMRIFGATELFVRLPLVLEGALVGTLGGVVACAAVAAAVASVRAAIGGADPGIAGMPIELPALWTWAGFLLLGPVLGAVGATVAAGSAGRPVV